MIKPEKDLYWYGPFTLAQEQEKLAEAQEGLVRAKQSKDPDPRPHPAYFERIIGEQQSVISGWPGDHYKLKGRVYLLDEYERLMARAVFEPQAVGTTYGTIGLWLFDGSFYRADRDLDARDVLALLSEQANRRRLKLEKAHAVLSMTENLDARVKRQRIPQDVKVLVWQRDGGRCVDCDAQSELEFDHIIPLAMGGSNTERNLQLLCAACNRRKGATLG